MVARFLDRTDAQLLAWTLLTKVAVLVIGYTALSSAVGGTPGFLDPWHRWDAPHYTDIAVFGYRAEDPGNLSSPGYSQVFPGDLDLYIVFFPLFPWLIAAVNAVIGEPIVSAFVVATVASLFVAPLLYRLVSVDMGHRIGLWTAGFLLVFPTAYFLHIGYTESLFLSLAFGSMWLARTNRWWLAGLLAALAAMTRVNGLILAPALLVEAFLQWRADPDRRLRVAWLAIGGVGIGFGVYLLVNQAVYGDPFAFSEIQRTHWYKNLTWPWVGLEGVVGYLRDENPDSAFMYGADGAGLHRTRVRGDGRDRALAAPDLGRLDGGQLDPRREHRIRAQRAALQPADVRDHGVRRDDRRPMASGRLDPGGGIGSGNGVLHLALRLRPMGVLSRTTKCPEGTAAIVEVISDRPAAPSGPSDDRRWPRGKTSPVVHEMARI